MGPSRRSGAEDSGYSTSGRCEGKLSFAGEGIRGRLIGRKEVVLRMICVVLSCQPPARSTGTIPGKVASLHSLHYGILKVQGRCARSP
jgi:hypothetical protein